MVGAGFSLNAIPKVGTTTPFPMWRELVRAMFDQLHPFVPGVSNAQELNDSFNRSNWLRVASEFEAAFGATKLDHLIRTQIPDASYIPGSLHEKLMKLPWIDVFTTNYDTLLERTPVIGRVYTPISIPTQLSRRSTMLTTSVLGSNVNKRQYMPPSIRLSFIIIILCNLHVHEFLEPAV